MNTEKKSENGLLSSLRERAKELNCLYEVEELFSKPSATLEEVCRGVVQAIPIGWQFPNVCRAKITLGQSTYQTPDFRETAWMQHSDIVVQGETVGRISVYYTSEQPPRDEGPFLKEERRLINTIAERFARRILHERLRQVFESQKGKGPEPEWHVVLDLIRRTDPRLLTKLSRRMLNYLAWAGIREADRMLQRFSPAVKSERGDFLPDENRPSPMTIVEDLLSMSEDIFTMASKHLSEKEILSCLRKWIKEDRSGFLVKILENPGSSLTEVAGAIERFHHLSPDGSELTPPREKGVRVSLIRRLLSDHPPYIDVAKQYVEMKDFYDLLHRIIFPAGSHGKLGGKGAGLFLATCILQKFGEARDVLRQVRTPKSWYLASDGILDFINYNDLEDIVAKKYEDISQVRLEYPYVVHLFKNSTLPPDIINGLSVALDDFGETPLIVRSSSLLEDRLGTTFAGKYKSLFIANQGSKQERLVALMDAIAEVYASTFGPDPIEYRIERGLIDFHEEMGILIQEVVGTKVGRYYLPAFAGVAFSKNEFRWSRRIKSEDGLIRMVPGLGTRAVDRLSDDYPILVAPGQPSLRVNITVDEQVRYSPKKVDVINLEKNAFETVEIRDLLRECGDQYPLVKHLVSVADQDELHPLNALHSDFENESCIVTFDGLINRTPFIEHISTILHVLQGELKSPVDIEFAHDGTDLYLLQCRPQSYTESSQPVTIPRDIPKGRVIFSANRYVSNGLVSNITHMVYVDPQRYSELKDRTEMLAVGKAVGRLNQILPKRQFILVGPGRWGSRGDIKLGVGVTYSDINNTAMLIEVARRQKDYVPELSFGTHFFQDLVEASIRYLPLYPDDAGVVFNEEFFTAAPNMLASLVPEFAHLSDVLRVVDVTGTTHGQVLQVLMNGDQDEAVGILAEPVSEAGAKRRKLPEIVRQGAKEESHWRWRLQSAERLAAELDPARFGVRAIYIFGSTKNGTAGPQSDIDLLVHFQGTEEQRKELMAWLEGWSLSLSHVNFLRTGFKTERLLDVHVVTDQDLENRTSFAVKIGATTDSARPLPLGNGVKR